MKVISYKNFTGSINQDLKRLSTISSVAYFVATLVLCGTIMFSYYTLRNILIEQSYLNDFGTSTSELRLTIRESSLYLSDLKQAKKQPKSESRLEQKITQQINTALLKIENLKEKTSFHLSQLQRFDYFDRFNTMFNNRPDNIWMKLDQYVARLKEVSAEKNYGMPGAELLWLPVEATAAKNGALGLSYETALNELQVITKDRANHLETTLKHLSMFSILIVLLEILLIFYPLKQHLGRVNTNLKTAHEKLYLQANYDQQTNLPNTSGISKQLSSPSMEAQYDSLMIVSILNIETISRIVGPTHFDEFFKQFSKKLAYALPADSMIFRAGDNEFGVVQKSVTYTNKPLDVFSLQRTLAGKIQVHNTIVYPEYKLGSADGAIKTDNLLIKIIDARLSAQHYNQAEPILPKYQSSMRLSIDDENLQIEKIRIAIQNKEFVPYYQIKVDAKTGKACGMEALCRWIDSAGHMTHPGGFIPLAEKSGLISEITWQLLDTIAADYKQWREHGLNPGRIAFNAAEMMLREADFVDRIKAVIIKTGTSQCPLDLEITENVALEFDSESIATALAAVRELGMKLALDDFGTGYASLSSIVNLDIDTIKVDRSFVQLISTSGDARNIVASIIKLCQQLEKKSVVEGVETEEEWAFCRDHGCDEIQGFLFHKPAPYEHVLCVLSDEQQLSKAS